MPALLISPFTRGGYVSSETFDHTSVLRLLETRFGVEVPNLTDWRRQTCGDLSRAINFAGTPDLFLPELPNAAELLEVAKDQSLSLPFPKVPAEQVMPTQEPGTRPRVAPLAASGATPLAASTTTAPQPVGGEIPATGANIPDAGGRGRCPRRAWRCTGSARRAQPVRRG